jgi:hypothetical protein
MAMATKISWDLATVTSCIDVSMRIVTKSPKVGPQLIFSIPLDGVKVLRRKQGK